MIEFGHFRELRKVLDRVNGAQGAISSQRRTMVFSATLTVDRRTTDRKRKKKTTSSRENLGGWSYCTYTDYTYSKIARGANRDFLIFFGGVAKYQKLIGVCKHLLIPIDSTFTKSLVVSRFLT